MATIADKERSLTRRQSLFAPQRPRPSAIAVLRADPDLAARLPPDAAARATQVAWGRSLELEPGRWDCGAETGGPTDLGLLLVDGLVCRSVHVGAECSSELLGAGDIVRPWADDDAPMALECSVEYEALVHTTAALLDRAFVARIAPWPSLTAELVGRVLQRAHARSVLNATAHVKRVDLRLLALFWYLADRWGRVRPDGILVPIKLRHATLGALIGAQRPSVTTVLGRMAERGILTRTADGHYLLAHSARRELDELCPSSEPRP